MFSSLPDNVYLFSRDTDRDIVTYVGYGVGVDLPCLRLVAAWGAADGLMLRSGGSRQTGRMAVVEIECKQHQS